MNVKGKNIIITGGANGLGFEIAKQLVSKKANVVLFDLEIRDLENAREELEDLLGGEVYCYKVDVTDKKLVYETSKIIEKEVGNIDVLINNAGFVNGGYFLETVDDVWEKTISVNLTSMVYTIRAFLPQMNKNNSGSIINISAISSLCALPGLSVFSASKSAVANLTASLRHESENNGHLGVRWTTVIPNFIEGGTFKGAKLNKLGNFIFPLTKSKEEVAKQIIDKGIIKGKRSIYLPKSLKFINFLRGILPEFLFNSLLDSLGFNTYLKNWKGRI